MTLKTQVLFACLFVSWPAVARAQNFQGLGDLPGGVFSSEALGISGDGNVVVGVSTTTSGAREAFRWSPTTGMVGLGVIGGGVIDSVAHAASFDGSVIVGSSASPLTPGTPGVREAFRWEAGVMTGLGNLGGAIVSSEAYDISADGSVVVGGASSTVGAGWEAYRWMAQDGMVGLSVLTPTPLAWASNSSATACSADGAIIFGSDRSNISPDILPVAVRWTSATGFAIAQLPGVSTANVTGSSNDGAVCVGQGFFTVPREAFRVTPASGLERLGDIPGGQPHSIANDVSGDGEIVVGLGSPAAGTTAIIWDSTNGLRNLQPWLITAYGLNLAGWQLQSVEAISDDGTVLCGFGLNPQGNREAWRLVLPSPMLPPSLCDGDGGDQLGCTDCPCGNNASVGTVGGCLNSAGRSARLFVAGSPSVSLPAASTTDLRFAVSGVPAGSFCVLTSGDGLAPASAQNPCLGLGTGARALVFDGLRCAIVNTRRHGGRPADLNGQVGVTNTPWGGEGGPPAGIANAGSGFGVGQTRYFQIVNRDDPLLSCTRGLNTSQAIEVTFIP